MKILSSPIGGQPGTRRMWPRWLALAAVVIGLSVAFVNLGFWQLDRLEQRRERNSTVVAHENAPIVAFEEIFGRSITETDQWQRVRVRGTFDAGHQFLVRYRSNAGSTGYEVVTPLRTTSGAIVLVDRGFIARPSGEDFPSSLPSPPAGEVDVVGHVRRSEQGSASAVEPIGNHVRLINSEALGRALGVSVVDGYLGLLSVEPAQTGDFAAVQPPEPTEGSHLVYAVQWFMFTGMAALGLIVLIRSDLKLRQTGSLPVQRQPSDPRVVTPE